MHNTQLQYIVRKFHKRIRLSRKFSILECSRCVWDGGPCPTEHIDLIPAELGMCFAFNHNQQNILESTKQGQFRLEYVDCDIVTLGQ